MRNELHRKQNGEQHRQSEQQHAIQIIHNKCGKCVVKLRHAEQFHRVRLGLDEMHHGLSGIRIVHANNGKGIETHQCSAYQP